MCGVYSQCSVRISPAIVHDREIASLRYFEFQAGFLLFLVVRRRTVHEPEKDRATEMRVLLRVKL